MINFTYQLLDTTDKIKQVLDNRLIIKYILDMDSINLATVALLSARNYNKEYFQDIDLSKFKDSKDEDIRSVANKIINKTRDVTSYERMMYLHTIPLFKSVKFYNLQLLAKSTEILEIKKGEYIIRQGEAGDALFIILDGKVEADKDGTVINTLGTQEYFGAVALLGDVTRTVSVKAVEDVTLLTLSKEALKQFMNDNPVISAKVMKNIIRTLLGNKKYK